MRTIGDFEAFAGLLVLDSGRRMRLEGFQKRMLADFVDGRRETVTCIAKGSGKTTLLGALALYELLTDPNCSGGVCAASRDQAGVLLTQLRGFVERTPGLGSRVRLKQREAVNRRTGGRFRVLAADQDTLDGLLLTFAVADELHRWPGSERYTILLAGVQKLDGRLFGITPLGSKTKAYFGRCGSVHLSSAHAAMVPTWGCARTSFAGMSGRCRTMVITVTSTR
jgi:phage terminase large subunit-like protein